MKLPQRRRPDRPKPWKLGTESREEVRELAEALSLYRSAIITSPNAPPRIRAWPCPIPLPSALRSVSACFWARPSALPWPPAFCSRSTVTSTTRPRGRSPVGEHPGPRPLNGARLRR